MMDKPFKAQRVLGELFGKKPVEVIQLNLKGTCCVTTDLQDKEHGEGMMWQTIVFFGTGPVLSDPFFLYVADLRDKIQNAKKGAVFDLWLSDYGSDKSRPLSDFKTDGDYLCSPFVAKGIKKVQKKMMTTKWNLSFTFKTKSLPGTWSIEYSDIDKGVLKKIS